MAEIYEADFKNGDVCQMVQEWRNTLPKFDYGTNPQPTNTLERKQVRFIDEDGSEYEGEWDEKNACRDGKGV